MMEGNKTADFNIFPSFSGNKLQADTLPDMSHTCLGCICEATTNCNMTIGCMRGLCGPFLISRAYWIDAGRPVVALDKPERAGAYETCANDPYCSATAVRQYMARYAQVGIQTYPSNYQTVSTIGRAASLQVGKSYSIHLNVEQNNRLPITSHIFLCQTESVFLTFCFCCRTVTRTGFQTVTTMHESTTQVATNAICQWTAICTTMCSINAATAHSSSMDRLIPTVLFIIYLLVMPRSTSNVMVWFILN